MTETCRNSTSRWKAVAIGFLLLLAALIVWDGADRRAADATQPLRQSTPDMTQRVPAETLKIASFNIHGGKGMDGVRDLPRIAALLSDVDCAGLYEVRAIRDGDQPNQAASLGQRCHADWVFAPSERQWWSDHFGNGFLYRSSVQSFLRIPLVNTRGKAYRNAILSTAYLKSGAVQILAVHIDRENDRTQQLSTVIQLFLSLQEPCLIMGDLNTIADDPILQDLRHRPGVHSPLHATMSERELDNNIDWIFTRGLKTLSAKLVTNNASDHPLLIGEFEPLIYAESR